MFKIEIFKGDFKVRKPKIEAKQKIFMKYPEENVEVLIETKSKHTADQNWFHLENEINIQFNGEKFFANQWIDKIQRKFV